MNCGVSLKATDIRLTLNVSCGVS